MGMKDTISGSLTGLTSDAARDAYRSAGSAQQVFPFKVCIEAHLAAVTCTKFAVFVGNFVLRPGNQAL